MSAFGGTTDIRSSGRHDPLMTKRTSEAFQDLFEPLRRPAELIGTSMKRRNFITLVGGMMAAPFVARAQQAVPVVGFLDTRSPDAMASRLRAWRQGLQETGDVEGENVTHRLIAGPRGVLISCQS